VGGMTRLLLVLMDALRLDLGQNSAIIEKFSGVSKTR